MTWLLTLAVVVATAQVIAYHSEPLFELVGASTALLFALPTIRSSLPGIPTTPTVADGEPSDISLMLSVFILIFVLLAVGYYWHIALLGLSTSALVIHSVWQLRVSSFSDYEPLTYRLSRQRDINSHRISPSKSLTEGSHYLLLTTTAA